MNVVDSDKNYLPLFDSSCASSNVWTNDLIAWTSLSILSIEIFSHQCVCLQKKTLKRFLIKSKNYIRRCLCNSSDRVNLLPQNTQLQTKGRSPVCHRKCARRWEVFPYTLLQPATWQMCCFFLSELLSGITQFGHVHATRRTLGFTSWSLLTLMLTFTDVWLTAGWSVTDGVTLIVVVVVVLVSLEEAAVNGAGCIVTWLADDVAAEFFEAVEDDDGAIDVTCVITGNIVVWCCPWLCDVTMVCDWLAGADDDVWITTGDDWTTSGFTIHFVGVSCSGCFIWFIDWGVIVMVCVCVGCDETGVDDWDDDVVVCDCCCCWDACVCMTGDWGICWIDCIGCDIKFPFRAFAEITWTFPMPGMCWICDGIDWRPGIFGIWMMFWLGRICWAGITVICWPCAFVMVIGCCCCCWAPACACSCPLPSTFIACCWSAFMFCCACDCCWSIGTFANWTCWMCPDGVIMFAYCCVNCGTICIWGWIIWGIWLPKFWIGTWTVW